MANKYYYNGKLVRTSENHIYTHAIITVKGRIARCTSSLKLAEAYIASEKSKARTEIENTENAIKALKNGQKYFEMKYNRKTINYKFRDYDNLEAYESHLLGMKDWESKISTWFKIVELEKR